jgi:nucleoside-diphosphate-sugar epimerase
MKIAIIGANGQVGTELSFYLRGQADIEVVPVVRNVLGSAFLDDQQFSCRVFDICDKAQAKEGLADVDVVVISSYVFRAGKESQRLNRSMIENSISYSRPASKIIYLSSVRALGWRVDKGTPRFAVPRSYDRNKKLLEKYLLESCRGTGKTAIALRLGHVYGKNQPRTAELQKLLSCGKPLELHVSASAASNVVHTATIANCIEVCAKSNIKSDIYSLVNVPQWSWSSVFEYYNDCGAKLEFRDPGRRKSPVFRRVEQLFWKFVRSNRETFAELRQFVPPTMEQKIQRRFAVRNAASEIAAVSQSRKRIVEMREFRYKAMPEKFVPGLGESAKLLATEKLPSDIFK